MPDVSTDWVETSGPADGTSTLTRLVVVELPQNSIVDYLPPFLDNANLNAPPAPWLEIGCDDGAGVAVGLYIQPYSWLPAFAQWNTESALDPVATGLSNAAAKFIPGGVLWQRKWHKTQGMLLYQNEVATAYVRIEVCEPLFTVGQ